MEKLRKVPTVVGGAVLTFCLVNGALDLILNGPLPFISHVLGMF